MEVIRRSISFSKSRSRRRSRRRRSCTEDHHSTDGVSDLALDGHAAPAGSSNSEKETGSGRFLSPSDYDVFPTDSDDGISCQYSSFEVSLTPRSSFTAGQMSQPAARSTFSALSAINLTVEIDDDTQHIDDEKTGCDSDGESASHGSSNADDADDDDDDDDDDSANDDNDENYNADNDGLFSQDEKKLVGAILADKYRIMKELGRGTFGRVLECYVVDQTRFLEQVGLGNWRGTLRAKRSGLRAIKIIRNIEHYRKDAEIEADLLRKINRSDGDRGCRFFPIVYETFDLPTGQYCLVLEKLGDSLYDIIKKNDGEGFATHYIREISIQLFDALDHLHSKVHLIHTDTKPENILLVANNADEGDVRIKIIDMGSAVFGCECCDCNHDNNNNSCDGYRDGLRTSIVNTRQYRAPEILLRTGWSYPSDVWAAGCTIAELALGCLFFPTKSTKEHLAMIEKKVGRFPEHMLFGENNGTKCFDRTSSRHKMGSVLKSESLDYVENECHPLQDELPEDAMESGLYELLSTVLTIDPQERPNAKEALILAREIVEVEE